jgi:hypothetical protein
MPRSGELMDKVLATWVAYRDATFAFDAAIADQSLGVEHPDGVQGVENAARVRRRALKAHLEASKEYTDYLMEIERRQKQPDGKPPTQTPSPPSAIGEN